MRKLLPALFLALAAAAPAAAQNFPTKPVKLVLWGPGSFPDLVARRMTDRLAARWGQPVIVENKAGAAGILAADVGANAPADGHTLVWGDPLGWTLYAETEGKSGGSKSPSLLVPVSMVVEVPMVVFGSAKSPIASLPDFYAKAKASPTPMLYASPGVLSFHHLTLAYMAERMGATMTHVPTRGMGPILIAVAKDEIALSITGLGSMQGFLKDGKIRALAWTGRERTAALPDVPTLSEAGFPGFSMTIKAGFFAHKDTPKPLIERIARDLAEAAKSPEVTGFITANGAIPAGTTPEEFARAADKDIELLGPLARRLAAQK